MICSGNSIIHTKSNRIKGTSKCIISTSLNRCSRTRWYHTHTKGRKSCQRSNGKFLGTLIFSHFNILFLIKPTYNTKTCIIFQSYPSKYNLKIFYIVLLQKSVSKNINIHKQHHVRPPLHPIFSPYHNQYFHHFFMYIK